MASRFSGGGRGRVGARGGGRGTGGGGGAGRELNGAEAAHRDECVPRVGTEGGGGGGGLGSLTTQGDGSLSNPRKHTSFTPPSSHCSFITLTQSLASHIR